MLFFGNNCESALHVSSYYHSSNHTKPLCSGMRLVAVRPDTVNVSQDIAFEIGIIHKLRVGRGLLMVAEWSR